jgi:hypothetical protein
MVNNNVTDDTDTDNETYLEGDTPIPGQNFCCISFLSPEEVVKSKELYIFHRFMTQKYGEWDKKIDEVMKKSDDKLKNRIEKELREKLRLEMKYTYNQFKSNYFDFIYKFHDELEKDFSEKNEYRTSIRGVKVRGVYETQKEAEIKAKMLQKRDRTFHVFVGSVGQWLPWDPCADRVQNEEYLESELNDLMKEYKKNELNKDIFYEEQKQERINDSIKQKLDAEKNMKKKEEENQKNMSSIEQNIERDDPWMEKKKMETIAEDTADTAEDDEVDVILE